MLGNKPKATPPSEGGAPPGTPDSAAGAAAPMAAAAASVAHRKELAAVREELAGAVAQIEDATDKAEAAADRAAEAERDADRLRAEAGSHDADMRVMRAELKASGEMASCLIDKRLQEADAAAAAALAKARAEITAEKARVAKLAADLKKADLLVDELTEETKTLALHLASARSENSMSEAEGAKTTTRWHNAQARIETVEQSRRDLREVHKATAAELTESRAQLNLAREQARDGAQERRDLLQQMKELKAALDAAALAEAEMADRVGTIETVKATAELVMAENATLSTQLGNALAREMDIASAMNSKREIGMLYKTATGAAPPARISGNLRGSPKKRRPRQRGLPSVMGGSGRSVSMDSLRTATVRMSGAALESPVVAGTAAEFDDSTIATATLPPPAVTVAGGGRR